MDSDSTPLGSQPLKPGSGHVRFVEQRRLADAGLPGDDERAGTAAPSGFDHLLDPLQLGAPPDHAHDAPPELGGSPEATNAPPEGR